MADDAQPAKRPLSGQGVDLEAPLRLPGPGAEARAFWQVRIRIARTHVRQAFAHSRLRLSLVGVLSVSLWSGMFWLFLDGFHFLKGTVQDPQIFNVVVQAILGTFFTALLVMLTFSSAILIHGFLFRSRDLVLLLSLPARPERIFVQKFQETVFYGSWAFLLLGSPMLLAYGIVQNAPWYYHAALAPFLIAFAYIPTGVGALVCLLVVHSLPRRRHQVLIVAGILALVATAWLGWSLLTGPRAALLTPEWFQQTVTRLQFSQQQMLPSWWLSAGLLETAHRGWDQGMLFFCVLAANALMLRQAAVWSAGRWYRTAYGQLRAMSARRKQTKPLWLDRVILVALPCPLAFRLMLLKDVRLFRRDASQWSQFLLFFALLGFYFLNLRRFEAESRTVGWDNMMSFVNLTVVGLILSTLTTRHVYPMISLEIRRMWLLGLLGVDRGVIVWSKLIFAMGAALVPCSLLVLASDMMLGISLMLQVSHQATCLLLCLGLCSMAVGLGARMPNLQEDSPPRIAAGFGGTLNLVIGAGYIVLIVMLAAMPWHLHALASQPVAMDYLESRPGFLWWLRLWLWGGSLGSVLLTAVATIVPLRSGFRAFRLMET